MEGTCSCICLFQFNLIFWYATHNFLGSKQVPEESQLVFRAPAASLECCCFISDDEFLSGSDDGSVEHWSVMRKKPLHIVKNAHPLLTPNNLENNEQNDDLPNGSKRTINSKFSYKHLSLIVII